ncbi:MAG: LCP family protein [Actinobacteria bacterium]|nr:LCP family protein [Actinomycetota bacterium]
MITPGGLMLGYVLRHPIRATVILIGGVILGTTGYFFSQIWLTFEAVATEEFNLQRASTAMLERDAAEVADAAADLAEAERILLEKFAASELANSAIDDELTAADVVVREQGYSNPAAAGRPLPDEMFDAYLGVGSDESGVRADTIILALAPNDGAAPILVSLPRDLYVANPCTGGWSRINAGLGGCTDFASGTELIALMVEGFTGIPIDHVARLSFDGFAGVVNALGGTGICTEHPARDINAGLDLPGGCIWADGATTLAWARSRNTEELINGEWQLVASSDFNRMRHQQDILFQLAKALANFGSLGSLSSRLEAVAGAVRVDSGWSFGDAIATAWAYRGISRDGVNRFSINVTDFRTGAGELVLAPTTNFNQLLAEVYPAAAR